MGYRQKRTVCVILMAITCFLPILCCLYFLGDVSLPPSLAGKLYYMEKQLEALMKNDSLVMEISAVWDENRRLEEAEGPAVQEEMMDLETRMRGLAGKKLRNGGPVIAVVVMSCSRAVAVKKCIDGLLRWRPSKIQFPIVVSQDCGHRATKAAILEYGDEVTLITQPDRRRIAVSKKEKYSRGYYHIARHYVWALNQTFLRFGFEAGIIVEDDLVVAPDFFEYFLATYDLLKRDPTLWCVSAWNDNAKSALVEKWQVELLHRTDFFPGLGWMLTRDLWKELSGKWPRCYWDDWMRQPAQRKDRACIRPELPRTKTFGKDGVSNGLFFEKHLNLTILNQAYVRFTYMNLSHLLKDNYDLPFVMEVYGSPTTSCTELKYGNPPNRGRLETMRVRYRTAREYRQAARCFDLMDDFKSGVPRTAYRGVVSFVYKGRKVFLAPEGTWKQYNLTWR